MELDDLRNEIHKTPLAERITKASEITGRLCAESRTIKTSIPVQPDDEDIFLVVTLEDCAELIDLLWNFTAPDDPCQFDHNGHCQAHSWFRAKEECPHARAKKILKDDEEGGKAE